MFHRFQSWNLTVRTLLLSCCKQLIPVLVFGQETVPCSITCPPLQRPRFRFWHWALHLGHALQQTQMAVFAANKGSWPSWLFGVPALREQGYGNLSWVIPSWWLHAYWRTHVAVYTQLRPTVELAVKQWIYEWIQWWQHIFFTSCDAACGFPHVVYKSGAALCWCSFAWYMS